VGLGLIGPRRVVLLLRRTGVLSWDFGLGGRNLNGRLRGVCDPGVLDDLRRRVGVLAKRAATAPSRVGVVCHDAADYQSDTIDEALANPSTTMDPRQRTVPPTVRAATH